jgi:uncharacterized protein YggU (UPF0235/DUF167 family)
VTPGAKRDEISWDGVGTVRARVRAPAIEGRANAAVLQLLSDRLRVPRSSLDLIRGVGSRDKVVRVDGLELTEVNERLRI